MLQAICLFFSIFIVVIQCQVLDFARQLTPADIYCGRLRCATNGSLSMISMSIFDLTEKGNPLKLASLSVFAPGVSVDSSKIHVVNATGTISKYAGFLDIRFLRDVDCLYGTFQCELDFVNINGQPDVIRENLAPSAEENATILYSLAKIATQLKEHSEETDKQLEALKNILNSVLVELSRIDVLLNSTLNKDQQIASLCNRGMPHTSPREKFFLQGKMALCDTETDGGGWVVIQRRTRGDVDFYRGWDDYKRGFGTPDTDFWIGNDIIHDLSSQGYNELRIDFIYNKTEYFAQYTSFTLGDESSAYTITTEGHSGNIFDSMEYHNGKKFSTFDRDNDLASFNCAVAYHGAWWYAISYNANLNGAWAVRNSTGIAWYINPIQIWAFPENFTEIKIRRN